MRVIRSFLALKPNLATVESLSLTQDQLKSACREAGIDVRWVPAPNLHVTLRFLGQITEPMSHAVRDMLEPLVIGIPAFNLECRGLGVFPDVDNARVIYADLGAGTDIINSLYESVYIRLQKAGFNFEDKPFHPHVTLGRIKQATPSKMKPILDTQEDILFGTSLIRHFYCYQSDLTPAGAEYTAQWVLSFQRPSKGATSPQNNTPNKATPKDSDPNAQERIRDTQNENEPQTPHQGEGE